MKLQEASKHFFLLETEIAASTTGMAVEVIGSLVAMPTCMILTSNQCMKTLGPEP